MSSPLPAAPPSACRSPGHSAAPPSHLRPLPVPRGGWRCEPGRVGYDSPTSSAMSSSPDRSYQSDRTAGQMPETAPPPAANTCRQKKICLNDYFRMIINSCDKLRPLLTSLQTTHQSSRCGCRSYDSSLIGQLDCPSYC